MQAEGEGEVGSLLSSDAGLGAPSQDPEFMT